MSPSMLLSQLLPDVALAGHDPVLTGLVLDSRAVRPGNAFVAIAGFGAHGLGFVEQARAAGAGAILFEAPAPAELPAPPMPSPCRTCVRAWVRWPTSSMARLRGR